MGEAVGWAGGKGEVRPVDGHRPGAFVYAPSHVFPGQPTCTNNYAKKSSQRQYKQRTGDQILCGLARRPVAGAYSPTDAVRGFSPALGASSSPTTAATAWSVTTIPKFEDLELFCYGHTAG